ncbi:MAG: tetratricopeptide repeat protein [Candidatus Eisenbacteria bacterium]|nr:tetratricopeptide repeat protein [Candidatus Eisenbacteria bacterium]
MRACPGVVGLVLLAASMTASAAVAPALPDSLGLSTRAWTVFSMGLQAEFDGHPAEALQHYLEAEALGAADGELLTRKAICLMQLQRFEEARAAAVQAVAADSSQADAYAVLGSAETSLRRFPEAVEPLRKAVRIRPDARTLHLLSTVLEGLGRKEEALEPITRLIEISGNSMLLMRRGRILEELGRLQEAVDDYWDVVREDPEHLHAAESLERVLTRLERKEELISLRRYLVERFPDRAETRWALIRELVEQERWDEAEEEITEYRLLYPDDPMSFVQLGLVAYRRGETERGLLLLDEAVKLGPAVPRVLRWRMRIMFSEGMIDSAMANATRLLALHPDDAEAWRVLAFGRVQMNELDEAVAALRQWAAADSVDAHPWLLLASIHRLRGEPVEGRDAIRKALRLDPGNADALLEWAAYLEEEDRIEEAESTLRPLIEADSSDARALNFVGYMLAERGRRLEEAEKYIQEAFDLDPDNPAILDSMGWLWYKKEDLARAEQWLKRAIEKGGRHPEIFAHLATVQMERKNREDAISTLEKGLELNPEAKELRRLLDSLGAD